MTKIIDLRCRYTCGPSARYFVNRMSTRNRLASVPALGSSAEEDFFNEIQDAGITTAVSVSGCNPGAKIGRFDFPDRTTSNDQLSEVENRHPGRFLAVAGIDVSGKFHDPLAEIQRCVRQLGMRAVTIEPGRAPGCLIDDIKLFPIYELCQSLDVAIIPHLGPMAGPDLNHAHPSSVERIADAFPALRIICGHGCYPFVREAIVIASRRENIWLAPDGYFFHLGHEDWMHAINKNIMDFSYRFLFASAYPLTPIGPFVQNFLKLEWNPEALSRILFLNAIEALKLGEDPHFQKAYNL